MYNWTVSFIFFPKRSLPEECQDGITFHTESLQYRLPKLTQKMKKMCTTVTANNSFLSLVENLDEFTGEVFLSFPYH